MAAPLGGGSNGGFLIYTYWLVECLALAGEAERAEDLFELTTAHANDLGLLDEGADREREVLVGAWAVAPLAGEYIHQASQAIRAEIPVATLLDGVAQFPTYSEAYLKALEELDL